MPYPRQKTFQRWKECERCGLDYPLNELSRDYTGVLVCQDCYDIEGHEENMANVFLPFEEIKDYKGDLL